MDTKEIIKPWHKSEEERAAQFIQQHLLFSREPMIIKQIYEIYCLKQLKSKVRADFILEIRNDGQNSKKYKATFFIPAPLGT